MEMVKRGSRILVGSQFRSDRQDYSDSFSAKPDQLKRVLQQWYALLEMNPLPDEIQLVEHYGDIILVPKFSFQEALSAALPLKV